MDSGRMGRLKQVSTLGAVLVGMAMGVSGWAQTAPAKASTPPLRLQSLAPDTLADPFPAVNPKFFTADSPSVATVEGYLHAVLGYDANRIWRVLGIQQTASAGVSKVTVALAEKVANAKVIQAVFYVLPDGKHMIADMAAGVQPFGSDPYAATHALVEAKADGPWHGSASKDLLLVEFADLQCPHCKDAQPTMKRLAEDFPKARIVYENFPLVEKHPFALKAAEYGVCVAKTSNEAFFTYAQAVYDTQSQLTAEAGDGTLKAAVSKAGGDPAAVAACAAAPATKEAIDASVKLANELGVHETPTLMVNGRQIPLGGVPYETVKEIVVFQAGLDGVPTAAASPALVGLPKP